MAEQNDRDLNTLRAGGLILLASAALHLVPAFSGQPGMFIAAAIFAAIGIALISGMRWLAWPAFLVLCGGAVVAAGATGDPAARPNWAYTSILVADVLGACTLFVHLWRR